MAVCFVTGPAAASPSVVCNVRHVCEGQRARWRIPRGGHVSDLTPATIEAQDARLQATVAMCRSAEHLLAAIRHLPGMDDTAHRSHRPHRHAR
jgi:hypothetical protein